MTALRAIGLMSGTSMDGIDVAALETDGETVTRTGPSLFVPYDAELRGRLDAALETAKAIVHREDRPGNLADLERELTLRNASAVRDFLASDGSAWRDADIVGYHGQTVLHRPQAGITVQLGDGALLAEGIGLPVMYDMRANDMKNGGQGAPLVPAYHAARARSLASEFAKEFPVVFVNIGGISNITYVPRNGDPIAFDTGPGNMLIDIWVAHEAGVSFDEGGAIASSGAIVRTVADAYLKKPFFDAPGPKSLDRKDFSIHLMQGQKLADGARTFATIAAEAILRGAEHLPKQPKLWVICGGGRKNPHIVGDLTLLAAKGGARVVVAEEAGLDGDATEAEAWAFLAVRAMRGLPLTFPTTTGCARPVTGGVFTKAKGAR
jgi:anhydro-N-acetylmuramic acid kinase